MLAQVSAVLAVGLGGYSIGELMIGVIIVAAIIAITYIALKGFGIPIPPWFMQIVLVIVLCIVAVFAIRLIMSM